MLSKTLPSIVLATAVLWPTTSIAQPTGDPATAADVDTPPPSTPAAAEPRTIMLMREGSRLLDAAGRLRRDERTGWWTFYARTGEGMVREVEFVMLPNRQLEQMQEILLGEPDGDIAFEVSGEIFVYRSRNFLLPTGSSQVIPTFETPVAPARDSTTPPAGQGEDDSVEAIMRQLAEAVGPLQRRHVEEPATTLEIGPGPPDGAELLWRRGRIRRTDAGAWIFVFDADAEGMDDPPLIVMPCLLLERMEQYVARAGRTAPLLLSGRVHRYADRGYLLPTVFRVPTERTTLAP